MHESFSGISVTVLVLGLAVFLCILIKAGLQRVGVPSMVGFLVIGLALRVADSQWAFATESFRTVLLFLGSAGVICLLFRVGLESDLGGLIGHLRKPGFIWIGNVFVSGGTAYLACNLLLGMGPVPSAVVALALTATSVGVSVAVWQEAGALDTPTGELLIDTAEMDDLSAVMLMAVLFAVLPASTGHQGVTALSFLKSLGSVAGRLLVFGTMCFLFSRYAEKRVTDFCNRLEPSPDPMLSVLAIGFVIAALAGLLGFSVAIGAFFAGIVFSRDPQAVRSEASIDAVYDLFVPFFFIQIGFSFAPLSLFAALGAGVVLLVVAVMGKLIGTGLPALAVTSAHAAAVLGISMVPRAEIAMVVAQRGLQMSRNPVPQTAFSAVVLVSAITCIGAPIVLRMLFRRWPDVTED